ncbi:SUMF1/EgtB/PvdO family nonheme iron enzyme [Leadbettera azotonutricia]|uniref:PEGA domain protein n=1 Tax=Leadbettera azotonutricia (strain ATCC BAA-888 / DSM 13862 / ZAS-9) TaxID=545695 RepID=F5YCV9_LEAAZ|nr:SUMF1/EgtB/PvdO family nonheme iron enzyme [Leadbettera azotonutricia]AEF80983.1 PEGA domain protein [Leadbettera azotonutricia ZAS-9]
MPSKKPVSEEIDTTLHEEDKVHLKPFLGMRPGIYLAGIYSVLIVLILYFALLYPGISKPGSVLVVDSEPFGAAIRVDGVYMAAAPCSVFVPRGIHRVEAVLPGFEPYRVELEIKSRAFASLFAPLKLPFRAELKPLDPAAAFVNEAADFAAWTFAGEPTASYQIPLSLSEGAYRLGPSASNGAVFDAMDKTLRASARFAVTRASLRDLARAKFLLDNQGLSPSPLSLVSSAQDILAFLGANPGSAAWLADTLQDNASSEIAESSWYMGEVDYASTLGNPGGAATSNGPAVLGLNFKEISGGEFVQPGAFPHKAKVENFYLAETEITAPVWDLFLNENPKWRQENTAELMKQGLVNSDYLKVAEFQDLNRNPPAAGIPGISWHAARAFCQWLTAKLPPAYSKWEARLPTEAEWEYAAGAGIGMQGAYWEWCEDSYAPLDFFPDPASISNNLSPEKSVKGGAWISPSGSVATETRGSLPPYSCSAFVSFRPALGAKP